MATDVLDMSNLDVFYVDFEEVNNRSYMSVVSGNHDETVILGMLRNEPQLRACTRRIPSVGR